MKHSHGHSEKMNMFILFWMHAVMSKPSTKAGYCLKALALMLAASGNRMTNQ
jgi:hypothetical protein